jgi:hypothetical protein
MVIKSTKLNDLAAFKIRSQSCLKVSLLYDVTALTFDLEKQQGSFILIIKCTKMYDFAAYNLVSILPSQVVFFSTM